MKLRHLHLYSCYYIPKKKLNNSDRKNGTLLYSSFNETDGINDLKKELIENGIEFKEKYIHEFKEVTIERALNDKFIRNKLISQAIEKFGTIQAAYEKFKGDVMNSDLAKYINLKEETINA